MAVFSLLAAHLIAAAILNGSVAARRHRSPVRDLAQRRLLQRIARSGAGSGTQTSSNDGSFGLREDG